MYARDCYLGTKLQHRELGFVLVVEDIDGERLWVEQENGDIYDWVDEDLYREVY